MSDLSALRELAGFGDAAPSEARGATEANPLVGDIARRMMQRPQRRSVGELLGVVLVLAARTRRMGLGPVEIDLDVFGPGNERAVRIIFGQRR